MRRSISFFGGSAALWIALASFPFDARAQGADVDGDGVPDAVDNCTLAANPTQIDTDEDGTGNRCDPDFNNDCVVNGEDLVLFQDAFATGTHPPLYDLDGNGFVTATDLAIFNSYFGSPPGPPGCGAQALPADESARVALFAIDPEAGDLLSTSPALDSDALPPVDRSQSVEQFTIDANNGDLTEAPADVPDSGGAIDRSADVEGSLVDAETGDLIEGPANVADSGGAIDRTADVAVTVVDAQDGDLLSAPTTSPPQAAVSRSGMVAGTEVDSADGELIHGPLRFSVPEPAAPTALLAAGLLLLSRQRSRRALAHPTPPPDP